MTRSLVLLAALALACAALLGGPPLAAARGASCPDSNPPNTLVLSSGNAQTAKLGAAFGTLQVALANTNGCPVTGSFGNVSVDFVAPAGGASGTFSSTGTNVAVVGMSSAGVAAAPTFVANGTAGSYGVQAQSDYGTVTFFLTNTATGLAASIAAAGDGDLSASVLTRYGQALQATVLDAGGRPVQGATVSFSLATGSYGAGASFLGGGAQATATTDASGHAVSPPFVANGVAGRFTATASAAGVSQPASYALHNLAVRTTIAATAPAARTAPVGGRYAPLQATVVDAAGQPVEGATVTFAVVAAPGASGAGASFLGGGAQVTALTDADGVATSPPFVANDTAGSFTATATVAGDAEPATYALRNRAGTPATVTPGAASGVSATVKGRFPVRLAVTVADAHGNPVAGARVTFRAPARGASGGFGAHRSRTARVTTNADGIAVAPVFAANATPGGYAVRASVAGARPAAFALVNERAGS